ncbi:MAG: alpha/beta hydrolase [Burkholderiaceae bacterium]|nr:alpha/beta hydrolase [Sulfuritalea sp.]MCF8174450.1 alpha/beta hydrolase [Burkholderiaceae bacterium]MCF8184860.1 alpha/beta hydrolase [Polynucleobacter sp.]
MLVTASRTLVRLLPARPANAIIRKLAARTQRPVVSQAQQEAMTPAIPLRYGSAGNMAWSWGRGPLLVLVHGWNGRAAQMAPLATKLAGAGFRCVAIDVTGHGDSPGRRTGWRHFVEDTAAISETLGEGVHAYIGHSAGGLAMMAARAIKGIAARRFVCVCAPSHPFPPIRAVRQRLSPRPAQIENYKNYIAGQFDSDWDQLESGRAFAGAGADLLLFYDEKDRYVDHTEGDRIQTWCPGAQLIKTGSYGHSRVLAAPELERAITGFLQSEPAVA